MSQNSNTFACPRCGERLPAGITRCDACGAYIVPSRPKEAASSSTSFPPWAFLVIGLAAGALLGYGLRAAVTPRMEGGAPAPANVMGGGDMGGDPAAGGAPEAPGGMQQTQMLPQVIEALAKYRNTLAEDPTNVEANVGMGNLMFDSGKWEKAIEHYTAALKQDPKNADVRVDRAISYHSIGQDQEALDDLKRVTREQPTHQNAWLNLGVVAGTMGDKKTNIAAWEQYLKLDPTGQHADAVRGELAKLR